MLDFFKALFINKILLSVVFSYIIASIIKIIFYYFGTRKIDFKMFFRTGGMPSSHASSVSSMTTIIYLLEGMSNLFMVCFIVSLIIISDALGIRRAAGKQAKILNEMLQEFWHYKNFKTTKLYELLGHTPKQVIAGIILGVLIAHLVFKFF